MEILIEGLRNLRDTEAPILIKVSYPKGWKVSAVKDFEEFKDFTFYRGDIKTIEWEYVLTQSYSKNCNGYAIYWLSRFNRLAINRDLKIKRTLTVGEAWSFGDNID